MFHPISKHLARSSVRNEKYPVKTSPHAQELLPGTTLEVVQVAKHGAKNFARASTKSYVQNSARAWETPLPPPSLRHITNFRILYSNSERPGGVGISYMQSCRRVLPISTASINCKQVFARKIKYIFVLKCLSYPSPQNKVLETFRVCF